ncbi:threonine aldolase family protein [Sulfitobacter donghicola]|uniref:Threonine aldolase n=1 Tax=Sulfitobacter donghicola DSW-25 = KCTC 12864 = JCM 14565 TaxID=1300350 RepID=A0A073IGW9_9RHOB|nr:low specificity L-threonine aldolase [Sulfitobacter donghicola]KEJ88820.1 threonine aldolase [Sulfitobacter donghicola DSW-25 = KCTC 12864 = JCM 14565]KIN68615.1 L-threonine aldolase, low-specificity [Sulfitobacter donghicola DSW-25 = KCTC 12864 = JCM 14565]
MFFASDNSGPVHPKIMQRMAEANTGYAMPYGNDEIMEEVRASIRAQFEAPDAAVYLVATGTAANSLALACYTQPWQTIFCAQHSHIEEDECNAPEFYAGGAKLTKIPTEDKMAPADLASAIARRPANSNVHMAQAGPVSITQVTEFGAVHTLEELRALTAVAKAANLPVHLDGARFANALVALDCTPAEMTWKSGVDVVSFGGTKNGCMGVEAVIFFDPAKAWEFELRRKRGAHLFSKHRYLSAQMAAYLQDDLWQDLARSANAACARLAEGLVKAGAEMIHTPQANMIFTRFPRAVHQKLQADGAKYYVLDGDVATGPADEILGARLVCDWSMTDALIDQFLSHF